MTTKAVAFTVALPGFRAAPPPRRSRFVVRAKLEPSEKSVEIMRKFSEQYARRSGTYFCVDKGVTSVVIKERHEFPYFEEHEFQVDKIRFGSHYITQEPTGNLYYPWFQGLADHKDSLGAPLCPCRHYDDKAAEAGQGFWNCPCVPMRERKECHCMLFLTPDNDFAGDEQIITLDEIAETTKNL